MHVVQVCACILTCKGWIGLLDLWETGEEKRVNLSSLSKIRYFLCFHLFDFDNLLVESLHQKWSQQMLDLRSKSSLVSACEHVIKYSKTPASHSLRLLIHQNNQILFCRGIFLRIFLTTGMSWNAISEIQHSEVRPLQPGDKVKCQLYIC